MGADFVFSDTTCFANRRVHLAVSGSVAAYKACDLLRCLVHAGLHVSAALSKGATQFVRPLLFQALGAYPVYDPTSPWREEPFAHLEPGQHAELMLIAPASADMLAKLAHGAADDIVAAQALAFPKSLLVAPAMNPRMWANPAVIDNTHLLAKRGIGILSPKSGTLSCGEEGQGKLPSIEEIVYAVFRALAPKDFLGKKVLVTLGPTREFWDGVRFWSNPSSGRMGLSVALAFWLRGATVTLLAGPIHEPLLPKDMTVHSVVSAKEMHAKAQELWPSMDIAVCTAAVSDFAPDTPLQAGKQKKTGYPEHFSLPFHKNPDILAHCVRTKTAGQRVVAFAAETCTDMEALRILAHDKLRAKGADLLAANRVNSTESGFGTVSNTMVFVDQDGREEGIGPASKSDIAWRLCSWLSSR
ncbi:MAG: bifunctional phosphopantothenoylcysteine decarboxylase/phosphopantothenate--cysteine ligase CoaBC [Desulfovibrio sp.]|nr:bifunctional phosphopantothenoylcysteine decarboxylase/phosphopantothenate--cysteine ligase CoaBC [Desulfovibrio sp.]